MVQAEKWKQADLSLMKQCQRKKSSLHFLQPVDCPSRFPPDLCREQLMNRHSTLTGFSTPHPISSLYVRGWVLSRVQFSY